MLPVLSRGLRVRCGTRARVQWYPELKGVFVDEMAPESSFSPYYAQLRDYANSKGLGLTSAHCPQGPLARCCGPVPRRLQVPLCPQVSPFPPTPLHTLTHTHIHAHSHWAGTSCRCRQCVFCRWIPNVRSPFTSGQACGCG
jgi:hypothetical protein